MRLLRFGGAAFVCAALLFGSVAGAADPPPPADDESWPHEDPDTITEEVTAPVLYTKDENPIDRVWEQLSRLIKEVVEGA